MGIEAMQRQLHEKVQWTFESLNTPRAPASGREGHKLFL
jgi:hypothetical protein